MIETSERPLKEIRILLEEKTTAMLSWLNDNCKFRHADDEPEYILLIPHPKHKVMDGMDIDEFLKDCPDILSVVLREIYNERVEERENNRNSDFDLDNDFGFILIAFV